MRKGEIARYEQFLLFPQCFQRHVLITPGLVWERVNASTNEHLIFNESILHRLKNKSLQLSNLF